jgi:hypothetical protein
MLVVPEPGAYLLTLVAGREWYELLPHGKSIFQKQKHIRKKRAKGGITEGRGRSMSETIFFPPPLSERYFSP